MAYIGSLQGTTSSTGTSVSSLLTPGSGISGLASGINTDSMVQGLMAAAQVPLVELLQQRQILQWQETRYQQVNAALTTLQNSVQSMQLQSTFMANSATSSNSTVVSATASDLAPQGSYSVSVQQLAQGSTIFSSSPISTTDSNYPSNTTLTSLGYSSGVNLTINGQSLSFQGTDTLATVLSQISSDTSMGVSAFYDSNSNKFVFQSTATGSQAMIKVTQDTTNTADDTAGFFAKAFNVNPAPTLTGTPNVPSTGLATAETIEINGQKIQLSAGDTLSQIETAINNAQATTGVTVGPDPSGNGDIVFSPSSTDANSKTDQLLSLMSISDPGNVLGLHNVSTGAAATSGNTSPYAGTTMAQQAAQDAQFTVNGFSETSSTNQPVYNGLNLNLDATSTSPVQINVSVDAATITKSITNFVQQYNQTLQLMQGLYNEKRNNGYQPLTATQASQMTQTQIDQWNEQAQKGVLENDPEVGGVMSTLQNDMQNIVLGQSQSMINGQSTTLNSLASIGITPIDPLTGISSGAEAPGVTTTGWNSYGLLQIDPTKLQAAIQADPQAVMRLFTNNPNLPGNTPTMGTGIAVQMYNDLNTSIKTLTQQAGSNPNVDALVQTTTSGGATVPGAGLMVATPIDPNANFTTLFATDTLDTSFIGEQLNSMDTQATSMQQQLNNLQSRYRSEFAQMEQSLSQLNSQQGGLSAMMGGGGSSSSGG